MNLFELRSLLVFTFFPSLCFEQIAPSAGGDRPNILIAGTIRSECGSVAVESNSNRDVGGVAFSPLTRSLSFKSCRNLDCLVLLCSQMFVDLPRSEIHSRLFVQASSRWLHLLRIPPNSSAGPFLQETFMRLNSNYCFHMFNPIEGSV